MELSVGGDGDPASACSVARWASSRAAAVAALVSAVLTNAAFASAAACSTDERTFLTEEPPSALSAIGREGSRTLHRGVPPGPGFCLRRRLGRRPTHH